MRRTNFILFLSAVTGSGWEYPEHDSHWGDSCADQERGSPIDFRFLYELNKYRDLGKFTFSPGYGKLADWDVTNNGHSIVLSNPTNKDAPVEMIVSGGGLGHNYKFHSFHFHWGDMGFGGGSEHTVNGKHYFSEVHLVHHRADCADLGECLNYPDGLAVLGFFIEVADDEQFRDNLFLHRAIAGIQRKHMSIGDSQKNALQMKLNSFLPTGSQLDTFYRYEGSLTTPGCNEVVIWTVFKNPIPITKSLARSFARLIRMEDHEEKKARGLYTKRHYLENNYREAQAMSNREVIISSPSPALMPLVLSNEALLHRLEKEIDSKDNFSATIAKALKGHM